MGTGETRPRPRSETARRPTEQVDGEAANPISGLPVKGASAERESERPIVPRKPGNAGGGKGPYLIGVFEGGKRR